MGGCSVQHCGVYPLYRVNKVANYYIHINGAPVRSESLPVEETASWELSEYIVLFGSYKKLPSLSRVAAAV